MKRTAANAVAFEPNAALDDDLNWARTLYLVHREYRSRKHHTKRLNRLGIARTALKRLIILFSDEEQPLLRRPPIAESPTEYLSRLLLAVDAELTTDGASLVDLLRSDGLSAFEWFVGKHLREIYEKHFGQPATARDAARLPNTPYVCFVEEVLEKFDIKKASGDPYARESIAKAMSIAALGGRKTGKSK